MPPRDTLGRLTAAAAVGSVLAQVGYPLVHGAVRDAVTGVVVLTLAVASLAHAAVRLGTVRALAALGAVAVAALGVEVLGVHTGWPFGPYRYLSGLGPSLGGVPLLVAAAWTMMAWPAAVVATRLARSTPARVVIGAWALTAWDLFLDPQMVAAGHWRWQDTAPHLPGVPDVPLSNLVGWFAVSLLLSMGLQRALRTAPDPGRDTVPVLVYGWTWFGSTVALGVFLGLPAAAAWGALGMGVVAVPALRTLRPARRRPAVPPWRAVGLVAR